MILYFIKIISYEFIEIYFYERLAHHVHHLEVCKQNSVYVIDGVYVVRGVDPLILSHYMIASIDNGISDV